MSDILNLRLLERRKTERRQEGKKGHQLERRSTDKRESQASDVQVLGRFSLFRGLKSRAA